MFKFNQHKQIRVLSWAVSMIGLFMFSCSREIEREKENAKFPSKTTGSKPSVSTNPTDPQAYLPLSVSDALRAALSDPNSLHIKELWRQLDGIADPNLKYRASGDAVRGLLKVDPALAVELIDMFGAGSLRGTLVSYFIDSASADILPAMLSDGRLIKFADDRISVGVALNAKFAVINDLDIAGHYLSAANKQPLLLGEYLVPPAADSFGRNSTPDEVFNKAAEITEPDVRKLFSKIATNSLASANPQQLFDALAGNRVPADFRILSAELCGKELFLKQGQTALPLLEKLENQSEMLAMGNSILETWLKRDSTSASEWVRSLGTGALRQSLCLSIAKDSELNGDREAAAAWRAAAER